LAIVGLAAAALLVAGGIAEARRSEEGTRLRNALSGHGSVLGVFAPVARVCLIVILIAVATGGLGGE
jgi:hypothetical protein